MLCQTARETSRLHYEIFHGRLSSLFAAVQSGDVILRRILKPTQDAVDYHREIAAQLADITRDLRSMWCHLACCAETIQSTMSIS
jgi:hypothetical protein